MKKISLIVVLCTLAVIVATGCAGKDKDGKKATDNGSQSSQGTVVFTDKVVASSVAVVEILDVLGVPMVGVPTSSYELPESVANATTIGNPMSPDIEVIASLEPSVIVSVDSLSADLTEQFKMLGAEVLFVDLSSYDGLKETITKLGKRFGVEDKAQKIIKDFETRETAVAEAVKGKEAPSVAIVFGAGTSFMMVSEDAYVGDLVKRVGGKNIISDAPSAFSPVDMEYLAAKNPDYILFMSHANPEESLKAFKKEVEANPAWQNFEAVKNDNLITLPTGYFGMSANLLAIDAMEKLEDILYGEK